MDLLKAIEVSTSGMKAQGLRMRVIAENLANSNSIANGPNDDPYQRKVVSFSNELDRALGVDMVSVKSIETDQSEFGQKYDPGHPAADANGYVRTTNVNSLIEAADMQEANRTYEANVSAIEASKTMIMRTIDLLR